jgi:hypothetical protein
MSPNLVWLKLTELDSAEGSGVRQLDPLKNLDRIGDCTAQLEPTKPFVLGSPELKCFSNISSVLSGERKS